MRLKLQLIPEGAFYSNLRKSLDPIVWQQLSKKIRGEHNFTCQFCGWKQKPQLNEWTHLHEVWEFDDVKKIQKLVGFECVCPTCHLVHHWGYASLSGKDLDMLLNHACEVNKCTQIEFDKHIDEAFKEWNGREGVEWEIDFNGFDKKYGFKI